MYVGRFAPTPSGPLHLGSLVTALGAYLRARSKGGLYLVRIEDLDQKRTNSAHTAQILQELQTLQLSSDRPIIRQSARSAYYAQMLAQLTQSGLTYRCTCTRSTLRIQPCRCRTQSSNARDAHSVCFIADSLLPDILIDALQGPYPTRGHWDRVVLRRRDGVYAYHLAVVCDDIAQGITEVVRGSDLLDVSAVHIALFRAFGAKIPNFLHLPLALSSRGEKYSKRHQASPALEKLGGAGTLKAALTFLGQDTSYIHAQLSITDLLAEAVQRFDLSCIDPANRCISY